MKIVFIDFLSGTAQIRQYFLKDIIVSGYGGIDQLNFLEVSIGIRSSELGCGPGREHLVAASASPEKHLKVEDIVFLKEAPFRIGSGHLTNLCVYIVPTRSAWKIIVSFATISLRLVKAGRAPTIIVEDVRGWEEKKALPTLWAEVERLTEAASSQSFSGGATMTFATILNVAGSSATDTEMNSGIGLALNTTSHLSTLLIDVAAPPPVGAHLESVSTVWLAERKADQIKLRKRAGEIDSLLASSGIPYELEEAYTEAFRIDDIVGRRAQFADAVLIGASVLANQSVRNAVIDGALFRARVPMLINPTGNMRWEGNSVLVALSDTPEAAAAARASVPLLKRARAVRIVMVDPTAGDCEFAAGLRSYLSHQGVESSFDQAVSKGLTVAETLEDHAVHVQADMLVMGAYGHTRLRERILGGVTKSALEQPLRPILLAR